MTIKHLVLLAAVWMSATVAWAQTSPDTLTVYFRQGKATVDLNYMGNDTVAAKIDSVLAASDVASYPIVTIRGGASPEGAEEGNRRLSRQRALAVARHFNIPDSVVTVYYTGSDWTGLRTMISGDPDVPFKPEVEATVSDIVDSPDNACPVDVLRNMHNGVPYRYMYDRHFPYLRKSEIVLDYVGTHPGASANTETDADTSTGIIPDSINNRAHLYLNTVIDNAESTASIADAPGCIPTGHGHDADGYMFGVKTNMLYDAALIPNIGVEFPIGSRFSVGADWMYAWWKNRGRNRHWRIYGGDVTARYWFGGGARTLSGHHLGVYGTVLLYQVAFGGKGYISGIPGQDMAGGKPWIGGGVEYGYSLNVHPRLNIDFSLGVGYATGEQRDYRMTDDCYVWQSSSRKHWFGPTKAGISLVWKIGRLQQTDKKGKEEQQ